MNNNNEAPATTCDTTNCDEIATQGIRILAKGALPTHSSHMCVTDATRVYDLFDPNRRGGKIELFDI